MKWGNRDDYQMGLVVGGEKTHAQDPDGAIICGAVGVDGSGPHTKPVWHENGGPFVADEKACKTCVKAWSKLP